MNRRLINQIKLLKKINLKTIFENKFLLYFDKNFEIYYAPIEYVNHKAKIVIINMAPDLSEMLESFKLVNQGVSPKKIKDKLILKTKIDQNLIKNLNKLNINGVLNIKSCESLFDKNKNFLHTTSIIKFPTFYKNQRKIVIDIFKNKVLLNFVEKYFLKELRKLNNCIIVPINENVSSIINNLNIQYDLKLKCFLRQFPLLLNKTNSSNKISIQNEILNLLKKIN